MEVFNDRHEQVGPFSHPMMKLYLGHRLVHVDFINLIIYYAKKICTLPCFCIVLLIYVFILVILWYFWCLDWFELFLGLNGAFSAKVDLIGQFNVFLAFLWCRKVQVKAREVQNLLDRLPT